MIPPAVQFHILIISRRCRNRCAAHLPGCQPLGYMLKLCLLLCRWHLHLSLRLPGMICTPCAAAGKQVFAAYLKERAEGRPCADEECPFGQGYPIGCAFMKSSARYGGATRAGLQQFRSAAKWQYNGCYFQRQSLLKSQHQMLQRDCSIFQC